MKSREIIPPPDGDAVVTELSRLPGGRILERILGHEHPRDLVRGMPQQDFYWLVKRVGDADSPALLDLASEVQWQYVLDLELWNRDRLDMGRCFQWFSRLRNADPVRLAKWLVSGAEDLGRYFFFRNIEVRVREEDDDFDPGEGFFSLDGVWYVRARGPEQREAIEEVLRIIADQDLDRYHALLVSLAGVLPAEAEEELYRLRNVRMAEHGFLPFEEALSVYAPLDPDALIPGTGETPLRDRVDEDLRPLAPVLPIRHAAGPNLLSRAFSTVSDAALRDRLRLEFAGLCNQILSADGVMPTDLDVLIRTCRKAAGYLDMALEKLCADELPRAGRLLSLHALVSIFRVGVGLAMKLKREAENRLRESWFQAEGLPPAFWGDAWGGVLAGLTGDRPRHYAAFAEGVEYRDFQSLKELEAARRVLHRVMALDRLMAGLTAGEALDEKMKRDADLTFHPILFNLWSRKVLGLAPGVSGISADQARAFFDRLRSGEEGPPFRMARFAESFVGDIMSRATGGAILEETLKLVWDEFVEEYAWVPTREIDRRFTRFLTISG